MPKVHDYVRLSDTDKIWNAFGYLRYFCRYDMEAPILELGVFKKSVKNHSEIRKEHLDNAFKILNGNGIYVYSNDIIGFFLFDDLRDKI